MWHRMGSSEPPRRDEHFGIITVSLAPFVRSQSSKQILKMQLWEFCRPFWRNLHFCLKPLLFTTKSAGIDPNQYISILTRQRTHENLCTRKKKNSPTRLGFFPKILMSTKRAEFSIAGAYPWGKIKNVVKQGENRLVPENIYWGNYKARNHGRWKW